MSGATNGTGRQSTWTFTSKTWPKPVRAGAVEEQVFVNPEHGSAAFGSDPFGHGFCLIERRS